jgi:hypothetical protein
MSRPIRKKLLAALLVVGGTGFALAQGTPGPTPGPTNPTPPPNPQAKPGATAVINPTTDQCRKGWDASMKWTKQQFDEFCTKLKASK